MNRGRLLTIVLSVSLIASLAYNFILSRQSEAAIFRNADGEITAISGLVSNVSNLSQDNTFQLEEPDTGRVFTIRANESTNVRFLTSTNEFIDIDFMVIAPGDNVFIELGEGGINSVAQSIDILPPEPTN